jgi:hypothetical protein
MLRSFVLCSAFAALAAGGCRDTAPAPVKESRRHVEPRQLGAWTGTGNTTLGFISESGSFRIDWKALDQDSATPGTFELILRSGISGRPMKIIADHRGSGGGSVEFGDDPRMYEFLVESKGMKWSISVDETFASTRP